MWWIWRKAKAGILVAAFELGRRGLHKGLGVRPVIRSPLDVLPLLDDIKDQQREHFLCLYLNARNQVIYKEVVSIGSLSSSNRASTRGFPTGGVACCGQCGVRAQPPLRRRVT